MRVSRRHIHIDSRCRDFKLWPATSKYVVQLPRLHHVTRINLTEMLFDMKPTYLCNKVIQYQVGEVFYTASIPSSQYTKEQVVREVARSMGAGFRAKLINNRVQISHDAPFRLMFNSGSRHDDSVHPYLGFADLDTECDSVQLASFELQMPLNRFIDVAVAEVPPAACKKALRPQQNLTDFTTKPEVAVEAILARIPLVLQLDESPNDGVMYKARGEDLLKECFKPTSINRLTISISDQYGKAFAPGEHHLTFLVEVCELQTASEPPRAAVAPAAFDKVSTSTLATRERPAVDSVMLLAITAAVWIVAIKLLFGRPPLEIVP